MSFQSETFPKARSSIIRLFVGEMSSGEMFAKSPNLQVPE